MWGLIVGAAELAVAPDQNPVTREVAKVPFLVISVVLRTCPADPSCLFEGHE
jgi:hypothetical protein